MDREHNILSTLLPTLTNLKYVIVIYYQGTRCHLDRIKYLFRFKIKNLLNIFI